MSQESRPLVQRLSTSSDPQDKALAEVFGTLASVNGCTLGVDQLGLPVGAPDAEEDQLVRVALVGLASGVVREGWTTSIRFGAVSMVISVGSSTASGANGTVALPRHFRQPHRADALPLPGPAHPPGQPSHPPQRGRQPARVLADRRVATRRRGAHRLLVVHAAPDHPAGELVRLAKMRWRIEHDYRELTDGLGLDHFEGRSYLGWHRHVTLASLAQAICTQLRYDPKPLRRPDYAVLRELQQLLVAWAGVCHTCQRTFDDTS